MTDIILAAQEAAQPGGSSWSIFVPFILIIIIMWFFMIRPQQNQQKKIREFQNSLTEGTSVVTGGGIYGKVKRIDIQHGTVEVEIARGVVITVDKGSVFQDLASSQPAK